MNAAQRAARRKAKANAGAIRERIRTTAPGLLLACRQAGESAVRFSAALAGTKSLKEVMPYSATAPGFTAVERIAVNRWSSDSRNPRDFAAEQAEQHARNLADLLTRGIVK